MSEEANVYQINRWDCPACGEIHESDADFDSAEFCEGCHAKVRLR